MASPANRRQALGLALVGLVVCGGLVALATLHLGTVGASVSRPAEQRSWPDFHGAGRDNISPEKGLLKQWPEAGPPLVWKVAGCGVGYSGVTIAEGRIITAGDFDDEEKVLALTMDGRPLWQAVNGRAWERPCPGSRTTPTYSDGLLYHMNAHGRLAAFSAQSGKEVWAVDLVERFEGYRGIWGYAENVVVDGDLVLCMPGGPKGRVVALDKRTGQTRWANTEIEHEAAYCSPRVVTHGGIRQLLTMTQKSVLSVEVASGKLLWSEPFVPRSPQNATTPVFHDGHVFVSCGHRSGGAVFKIAPDQRSASRVWWHEELDSCHSGVVLVDGKLFGSACRMGGKQFFCVDFLTGQTRQSDTTLSKVALSCAEGMLYCLNHQGRVSLLELLPDGFRIASQFDLPKKPANSYLAHPVICQGRLYLRCADDLYAYDIRDPQAVSRAGGKDEEGGSPGISVH